MYLRYFTYFSTIYIVIEVILANTLFIDPYPLVINADQSIYREVRQATDSEDSIFGLTVIFGNMTWPFDSARISLVRILVCHLTISQPRYSSHKVIHLISSHLTSWHLIAEQNGSARYLLVSRPKQSPHWFAFKFANWGDLLFSYSLKRLADADVKSSWRTHPRDRPWGFGVRTRGSGSGNRSRVQN